MIQDNVFIDAKERQSSASACQCCATFFVSHDGLTMSGLNVAETNRPVCITDSPRVVVRNQEKSRACLS